jgi:hypothetical protein
MACYCLFTEERPAFWNDLLCRRQQILLPMRIAKRHAQCAMSHDLLHDRNMGALDLVVESAIPSPSLLNVVMVEV